jgi:hypothetical protein
MLNRSSFLVLAGAVLALAGPASAHHSGSPVDRSETLVLEGVVKEWNYANPHAWLQIYVSEEGGEDVVWSFEATAATLLARQGYRRNSMEPGDVVSVSFNRFRDGANGGSLLGVKLSDGTVLGRVPGN